MTNPNKRFIFLFALFLVYFGATKLFAQRTQIKGFVAVSTSLQDDKFSFGFGEQDLFITSELSDHISFLGESVFKYSPSSATEFSASIERVIINFNYWKNHSFLIGKHHTPINYWNDTYHHGRVFFPTIMRPLLFKAGIIPIHTTGIAFQGLNLGGIKFGYNLMVGNGIGSTDVADNDKYKSVTAAIHIKPADRLQIGVSFYNDVISAGAEEHGHIYDEKINQQLYTGSISYFGSKFELLTETTLASNFAQSTGRLNSFITYLYAGLRLGDKWVPYARFDYLNFQDGEIFYYKDNTSSVVAGVRYEINYLIVVKAEYQHTDSEVNGIADMFNTQIAIGF